MVEKERQISLRGGGDFVAPFHVCGGFGSFVSRVFARCPFARVAVSLHFRCLGRYANEGPNFGASFFEIQVLNFKILKSLKF